MSQINPVSELSNLSVLRSQPSFPGLALDKKISPLNNSNNEKLRQARDLFVSSLPFAI